MNRLKRSAAKSTRPHYYLFDLNNYTEAEFSIALEIAETKALDWRIGKNKKKLEGWIRFKGPAGITTMRKQLPRATYSSCTVAAKNGINCSGGEFIRPRTVQEEEIDEVQKEYQNVNWKDWQREVLDIIKGDPDPRAVNWFWEQKGNVGKSFLCKYIVAKFEGVLICSGKSADVANQARIMMEQGVAPRIVISDIPRTVGDYINYEILEQLKNGNLYSGKYKGGRLLFRSPHVIVFANREPEYNKMSMDRWNVRNIGESEIKLQMKKMDQLKLAKLEKQKELEKISSDLSSIDESLGKAKKVLQLIVDMGESEEESRFRDKVQKLKSEKVEKMEILQKTNDEVNLISKEMMTIQSGRK